MNPKSVLRKKILKKRSQLCASYYQEVNRILLEKILQEVVYRKAHTIFVFIPMPYEFNTVPLIKAALDEKKIIAIPKVYGRGDMRLHQYKLGDQLTKGPYGIQEPLPSSPLLDPHSIDLTIMPCVTCNTRGERLGYGGGFYDRYLQKTASATLLPYFSKLMEDDIPMDAHDQLMDIILSEVGNYYFN